MDGVETGRTTSQARGLREPRGPIPPRFFAKVRFVGSSRIASTTTTSHLVSRGYPLAELTRKSRLVCSSLSAQHCPSVAHHGNAVAMDAAKGSIRQRRVWLS